jgi:hypothetical protein
MSYLGWELSKSDRRNVKEPLHGLKNTLIFV